MALYVRFFCSNDNTKPLHRVESDSRGNTLIGVKKNTVNDQVRTCLSELVDIVGAFALEKWHHSACLWSAQRTTSFEDYNVTSNLYGRCVTNSCLYLYMMLMKNRCRF